MAAPLLILCSNAFLPGVEIWCSDAQVKVRALDFDVAATPLFIDISLTTISDHDYLTYRNPFSSDYYNKLVGIALDGVPIFTSISESGEDLLSNGAGGGPSLPVDRCGGCLGPTPFGYRYHYRALPSCIFNTTTSKMAKRSSYVNYVYELLEEFTSTPGIHILGYSLKGGYPIFSPYDEHGLPHTNLDNCNGKYVNGSYGYYATPSFPYLIGCDGPGVYLDSEIDNSKAASHLSCPGGTYPASSTGSSAADMGCVPCPAGRYSSPRPVQQSAASGRVDVSVSVCNKVCPLGHHCPPASIKPVKCSGGRYGSAHGLSTAECSGLCQAGYFCPPGSTTSRQFPCGNSSFYCPQGSGSRRYVNDGFYTVSTSDEKLILADGTAGNGIKGEYGPNIRSAQIACEPGHFCVMGKKFPCPAGRYGLTSRLNAGNCTAACPMGAYCPEASVRPLLCPAGRYGSSLSLATSLCSGDASSGHFTLEGSTSPTQYLCPGGIYGPETGLLSKECSPLCDPAFLGQQVRESAALINPQPVASSAPCLPRFCAAGYFCPPASVSPTQRLCGGAQHYCPAGSMQPRVVDSGYYSVGPFSAPGSEQDLRDVNVRSWQIECERGYWCDGGVRRACLPGLYGSRPGLTSAVCSGLCAPGFICPLASTSPTAQPCGDGPDVYCPEGSFRSRKVEPGHYTLNGTVSTRSASLPCVGGFFCLSGEPHPCPAGRYSVAGASTSDCDGSCSPGFYCPPGSSSRTERPCPAGRFGSISGLQNSFCEGICAAGYYCPLSSTSATQVECGGESLFCPVGSTEPLHVKVQHYSTGGTSTTRTGQALCASSDHGGTPPAADRRRNVCPSITVL